MQLYRQIDLDDKTVIKRHGATSDNAKKRKITLDHILEEKVWKKECLERTGELFCPPPVVADGEFVEYILGAPFGPALNVLYFPLY